MFDPILLVFHKPERVSAAGARLHFAEVEALVGARREKAAMGLETPHLCHGCGWSAHGTPRHKVL